jgi:WD40 repeat protein
LIKVRKSSEACMPNGDEISDADDKRRRIAALQRLISPSTPEGASDTVFPEREATRRSGALPPYVRWLALALAIAVVVSGAAFWLHARAGSAGLNGVSTTPLGITPRNDGMVCPQDVAWTPNGKQIAIVGYDASSGQTTCPRQFGPSESQPGLVNVYDASKGQLLQQLHPDTLIRSQVSVPQAVQAWLKTHPGPATESPYTVFYTGGLWSHDATQLYLTFELALPASVPPGPALPTVWPSAFFAGVETLNLKSGATRLLIQPLKSSPWQAVTWDLTDGQALQTQLETGAVTRFATIPPALGYTWDTSGRLFPQTRLPRADSASQIPTATHSSIGAPDGGPSFSVWQPGVLSQYVIGDDDPGSITAQGLNFSTEINALSPDGRYLVEGARIQAIIDSSSMPAALMGLPAKGLSSMPVMPMRDKALQAASSLLANNSFTVPTYSSALTRQSLPWPGVYLAWRLDGSVLAIASNTKDDAITLLDTKTGHVIARLAQRVDIASQGSDTDAPHTLCWSPDGSHLLLLDPSVGALTIWGPSQLSQMT